MFPIRYLICTLCMFTATVTYISRSNISIAIVSMVADNRNVTNSSHANLCPDLLLLESETIGKDESYTGDVYDWSPELQGSILGCFSWSYFLCQVPSGYIANRFGGRWPITLSFLVTTIFSALGPTFAGISATLFIASRMLMGIFQAAVFPSLFSIVITWMPINEKSMGMAMCEIGVLIGNIAMYFSSGFLVKKYTWTSLFYMPAAASAAAFVIIGLFMRSRPEEHFLVSEKELQIIRGTFDGNRKGNELEMRSEVGRETMDSFSIQSEDSFLIPFVIPWKKMLTNRAVLTLMLFKFARSMIPAFISTSMPAYFKNVLNEDIVSVGIIYAVFTGIQFVAVLFCTRVSEAIILNGWLTRTNCRKVFAALTGLLPAIAFMLISRMRCNTTAVKALFYMIGFGTGCGMGSDAMLPAELTTNFSSILYAVCNIASVVPHFIAPMFTGFVLGQVGEQWLAWDIVTHSFAALGLCASLIFMLFISAETQDFDKVQEPPAPTHSRDMRTLSIVSALSYTHCQAL